MTTYYDSLTEEEKYIYDERVAICTFDGGVTGNEAHEIAQRQIEEGRRE